MNMDIDEESVPLRVRENKTEHNEKQNEDTSFLSMFTINRLKIAIVLFVMTISIVAFRYLFYLYI
jgi:hypothetical protein